MIHHHHHHHHHLHGDREGCTCPSIQHRMSSQGVPPCRPAHSGPHWPAIPQYHSLTSRPCPADSHDACLAAGLWLGAELICAATLRVNLPLAEYRESSRLHVQVGAACGSGPGGGWPARNTLAHGSNVRMVQSSWNQFSPGRSHPSLEPCGPTSSSRFPHSQGFSQPSRSLQSIS